MTTLQITFVSESAGYDNAFGWYNSRTGEAGIIFKNTNDDGPKAAISAGTTATIDVDQADIDAGNIGFFIIPNGASLYGTGKHSALNGPLSFDTKRNGDGQILDARGRPLTGEQGEIIFSDRALNKKDTDYTKGDDNADGILGRIGFEDLVKKSDRDYNDLVVDVKVVNANLPPVIENQAFQIAENSATGTLVGQVVASDPDAGQILSYAIVAGNESGAFSVNADTGEITVADASKLDFENSDLDSYDLTVQVTDSGSGTLTDTAIVSIAVTNVTEVLQGQALDGYVAGATVFADLDEDGVLDAGEASATTDASGNFALVEANGPLVMQGGVDISTGLAFTGVLRAPEGSTVVTPLTTLVAALVDQGQSIAQASANVTSAFGLDGLLVDGQPVDLLSFDPIPDAAAGGGDGNAAAQVLAAGIQVRNTILQVGALLAGAGATDAQAAATAALAALTSSGTDANLDDPATLQALIGSAADIATGVSPADIAAVAADAALVLAASNDAVNEALAGGSGVGVLQALAQVATVAQGAALLEDLAQAGAANDPGTLEDDYTGEDLEAKINNAPVGDVDGGSTGTPGDDILTGGPGNDVMDGLGGNDQLFGLAGNDHLVGGDGNDQLVGDIGNDTLRGGAGDDVLDGGVLADFQSDIGVRDTDRADYSAAAGAVNVNLAIGVAQDGDGGTDSLIGVEAVNGSAYDDVLTGGSVAFVEFFRGGAGNDTIDGGNWNDRAEYMDATAGISVTPVALSSIARTVTGDASVGTDTLINVENVHGSDYADIYVATGFLSASAPGGVLTNFNSFEGRGGNDTITGNGGTRIEFTGATAGITANLATGIATGDASVGTDTFTGVNSVRATQYADTLLGGNPSLNGFESFEGRAGNDYIEGGQGYDLAVYAFDGAISTGVTVNLAAGTVAGDPILTGIDTLRGVEGARGSHKDDWYDATGFDAFSVNAGALGPSGTYNDFEGVAGNDTIIGNGNTRIIYTQAREGVSANLATGTVVGGPSVGTDTILGGVWAVRGSNFDDVLIGSDAGPEDFEGRAGDDFIDGGGGFNVASYNLAASGGGTFIANGLPGGFAATAPGLGVDTLLNITQITGTNFGDLFDGSASLLGHTFVGMGGNDALIGSQGNDSLIAGDGDDVLAGGAGYDFMDGGGGFDRADYSSAPSAVSVELSATFVASDGAGGIDTLSSIEAVRGSAFDDTLIGDFANNMLEGGSGNDLLRGREGADYIDGGPGSDRIDFDSPWDGLDTVAGFEAVPGGDVIDIADLLQNWTSYAGGAGGPLSNFVKVETFGPDAQLQVNVGGVGSMIWQPLATLLGRAGLTLETLVANGNLDSGAVSGITLIGTPGNDFLDGTPGNDTIIADLGNDFLRGRAGNDLLNGGIVADLQSDVGWRDSDRIDYSSAFTGVNVNLSTGFAQDGEGGTDTLIGIESVTGSIYNDQFTGSGAYFESFLGSAGDDMINGAGGLDSADYSTASSGVSISLGGFGGFSTSTGSVSGDASVGFDTLLDVEQFIGSNSADTLNVGSFQSASQPGDFLSSFNTLQGRGGNDLISGNGNTRIEYSGATTSGVTVNLATGIATGDASVGTDTFSGVNAVRGSSFDDTLLGGNPLFNGQETLDGRGGNDFMDGGQGWDRADYGFNGAVGIGITVNLAAGTATGDSLLAGSDTLRGIEAIRGSHQADFYDATGFSGSSTNAGWNGTLNEFEGMAGNDTILGNGNTRLTFVSAREGVNVDLQAGTAVGGASVGSDTILGGVNQMRGSNFADMLMGTNHGITTPQIYEGRAGNDTFSGRGGFDQAVYSSESTQMGITVDMDAINAFTGTVTGDAGIGTDTLIDIVSVVGTFLNDFYDATGYNSTVSTLGTFNEFEGGFGNDTIIGNGNTRISFIGAGSGVSVDLGLGTAVGFASGNDSFSGVNAVRGSNFDDLMTGTAANETFEGRGGNDVINGGDGFDLLRYDFGASGGGTFTANASGGFSATASGLGSDAISGIESIRGTNFGDLFEGSASALGYTFDGRGGDDTLIGSQGADTLLGDLGNDLLRGGLGADFLNGGAGADRYDFNSLAEAGDTVAGFDAVPDGDVLDIADLLAVSTSYAGGAGGALAEFVQLQAAGPDALLQIDTNGSAGPATWQTLATLLGRAGLTLETLVANGNLDSGAVSGITLIGTPGNDFLDGTPGNDTIIADLGNDFLRGRAGNDLLNGGIVADLQSDVGWRDSDRIDYSSAFTGVNVNLSTGFAQDGEGGTDTLIGIESVTGSIYNDQFTGSGAYFESFLGSAGDDMINGAGGLDSADYSTASSGVSISLGGFGGFSTSTGSVSGDASVGFDTLLDVEQFIGSNSADTLNVGSFQSASQPGDFLSSFNTLQGRGGNDLISGNGNTRIEYSGATTSGVTVNLATGIATGDASVGTDTFSGVNAVRGSSFDDTLLGGNPLFNGQETLDGRGGNDFMDGGQGWDRADYGFNGAVGIGITVNLAAGTATGDSLLAGSDTLRGIEAIRGSHQADFYDATGFSGSSTNAGWNGTLNEFEGMAGNDTILGNGNTRASYAGARESVSVDLQAGTAVGGASVGHDTILGGVNAVRGSNFGDTLAGSASNDILEGLSGNDLLRGGLGADFLNGGAGSDTYDFNMLEEAPDTVSGFTAGAGGDVLDIADLLAVSTSYAGGAGGALAEFVQLQAAGPDGQLQIDTDGSAGGGNWQTLATLLGGSGLSLDTLVNGGNLDFLI